MIRQLVVLEVAHDCATGSVMCFARAFRAATLTLIAEFSRCNAHPLQGSPARIAARFGGARSPRNHLPVVDVRQDVQLCLGVFLTTSRCFSGEEFWVCAVVWFWLIFGRRVSHSCVGLLSLLVDEGGSEGGRVGEVGFYAHCAGNACRSSGLEGVAAFTET